MKNGVKNLEAICAADPLWQAIFRGILEVTGPTLSGLEAMQC
jgi:hypothetical protein